MHRILSLLFIVLFTSQTVAANCAWQNCAQMRPVAAANAMMKMSAAPCHEMDMAQSSNSEKQKTVAHSAPQSHGASCGLMLCHCVFSTVQLGMLPLFIPQSTAHGLGAIPLPPTVTALQRLRPPIV